MLNQIGALTNNTDAAVTLDGFDAKVALPNLNLTGAFTLESWVLIVGPGTSNHPNTNACTFGYSTSRRILIATGSANRVLAQMGSGSLSTDSIIPLNVWAHVVYTWNGNTQKIYINGMLAASNTQASSSFNSAFFVGAYQDPSVAYSLNGSIDEIAVYSTALSETRVRAHYETGSHPTFMNDTFTDTAGIDITTHTGEKGASWAMHPLSTGAMKINGTGDSITGDGTGVFNLPQAYSSGIPLSPDYAVEAGFVFKSSINFDLAQIWSRLDPVSGDGYSFDYYRGTSNWRLQKRVGGVTTNIGSYAETPAVGTTRIARMQISGTAYAIYIDGVLRLSGTDPDVTHAGRVGVCCRLGGPSTGLQISYVNAQ
jgi:hypothetical protein